MDVLYITDNDVDDCGIYLHSKDIDIDGHVYVETSQEVIVPGNVFVSGCIKSINYKIKINGGLEANEVFGRIIVRGNVIVTSHVCVISLLCGGNIITPYLESLETIEAGGFIKVEKSINSLMGISAGGNIICLGIIHSMGADGYIESKEGSIKSGESIYAMNHIFAKKEIVASKVRFGTTISATKVHTYKIMFGKCCLRLIGLSPYFVVE